MLIRQIIFLIIILPVTAIAQNGGYSLFRSFTVADGLPSNHIYNCAEDNRGFLWLCTDAGIARFDGKYFQTFTTRDGLPDDDVLDVVMENNGRIWINCFKQGPAYFDEVKNRFITGKQDTNLAKVTGTRNMSLSALKEGGVMYQNENGSYCFIDGKLSHLLINRTDLSPGIVVQKYNDGRFIASGNNKITASLFLINQGKVLDSLYLRKTGVRENMKYIIQQNKFYIANFDAGKYYIYSDFQINPFRSRLDSLSIDEPVYSQRVTSTYFTVVSNKGIIYVFDNKNLRLQFKLSGNYFPNNMYSDSKENIWICSVDKGLLQYKKNYIETFAMPDNITTTHFLSLARKPNGTLLAGNSYGQLAETDGKYFIFHPLPPGNDASWQRKIIVLQNKIFSFSEGNSYINFSTPLENAEGTRTSSKTAATLNDSVIIEGNIAGLTKINAITGKRTWLKAVKKRTTCIGVAPGNMIYHGSTDGLYKYDYNKSRDSALSSSHHLLAERITAITTSPDNLVWVATASHGVLALNNDSVVNQFSTDNGIISNSIKCISTGRPGEIWIGTNKGITILRYENKSDNFTYQNLTINDGLSSNIVNEMLFNNDTMYCATGNGICAIPASINLLKFDIPVRLTRIVINSRDTVLAENYRLKYYQGKIELHFAGTELGGHFNYFQYRIDNDDWQNLDAGILILQLTSGKHSIAIRAVDVNGNTGSQPLLLSFNISIPFWRSLWFWLSLIMLTSGGVVWFVRKREIAKREAALQKLLNQKKMSELELQALKSQINPHFIFNCLNSIKLLNHLQKHAAVEKYLDQFAALLRSALEQSSLQQITLQSEIEFIENYLSLEKLRLADKLSYTIETDKTINPSALLIPTMLLQPHIENAVKHGIAPIKDRKGLLQVRFYKSGQFLVAEVEDNGDGFDKEKGNSDGFGIGIENTERRSRLYNIESRITDLKRLDEKKSGTLVQLTIPLEQA